MLMIVAFALFAVLFAAWLFAPSAEPVKASDPLAAKIPETGTSPA